jgi:hypothetical protein
MAARKETSWLDDDPEWEALRHKTSGQRPQYKAGKSPTVPKANPPSVTASQPKEVKVSLQLKLPKLPTLSKKQKRWGMYGLAGILGLIAIVIVFHVISSGKAKKTPVVAAGSPKPTFNYLLPAGKVEDTSSKAVKFDPTKKVVSFTDIIEDTPVIVTQQPLPESFKDDPNGKVDKLAKDIYATQVISESNPKAYLGSNEKGIQTVVFQKNNELVFIIANRVIEKSSWAAYITKLQ